MWTHASGLYRRIFWAVLDGMGFEHASRAVGTGRFPAFARMAREGYLGSARPSSPVCETPPALLSLFAGAEPAESGVWGYMMPDPARAQRSVSGFFVQPRGLRFIWDELEEREIGYSLMNVAFRNDPVWSRKPTRMDFGYDGYRLWKRGNVHALESGSDPVEFQGVEFRAVVRRDGLLLVKGSRVLARIGHQSGVRVSLTRGTRAFVHLLGTSLLALHPLNPAVVRGTVSEANDDFLDANVFRAVRSENDREDDPERIPISVELLASAASARQKAELMLAAIRETRSRLIIGYFPLIDEFNHVYMDRLVIDWPGRRVSGLFLECVALVDGLLSRLMSAADADTLVLVSSDHGAAAYHGVIHLNELFARAGLVKKKPGGYDFSRSVIYYHPSDCGEVVVNQDEARNRGFSRTGLLASVHRVIGGASERYGVRLAAREGGEHEPYLAFLYPTADVHVTGRAPGKNVSVMDWGRTGGHHLSPLSPSPWMNALLGIWSPRGLEFDRQGIPSANREVKPFLLDLLGSSPGISP